MTHPTFFPHLSKLLQQRRKRLSDTDRQALDDLQQALRKTSTFEVRSAAAILDQERENVQLLLGRLLSSHWIEKVKGNYPAAPAGWHIRRLGGQSANRFSRFWPGFAIQAEQGWVVTVKEEQKTYQELYQDRHSATIHYRLYPLLHLLPPDEPSKAEPLSQDRIEAIARRVGSLLTRPRSMPNWFPLCGSLALVVAVFPKRWVQIRRRLSKQPPMSDPETLSSRWLFGELYEHVADLWAAWGNYPPAEIKLAFDWGKTRYVKADRWLTRIILILFLQLLLPLIFLLGIQIQTQLALMLATKLPLNGTLPLILFLLTGVSLLIISLWKFGSVTWPGFREMTWWLWLLWRQGDETTEIRWTLKLAEKLEDSWVTKLYSVVQRKK